MSKLFVFLITAASLSISLIHNSWAQTVPAFVYVNKPIICGPSQTIFKELSSTTINEKPVWIGVRDDNKTEFYLFLNFDNSAFTLLEMGKETGCVLGQGYKSQLLPPPSMPNTPSVFR